MVLVIGFWIVLSYLAVPCHALTCLFLPWLALLDIERDGLIFFAFSYRKMYRYTIKGMIIFMTLTGKLNITALV